MPLRHSDGCEVQYNGNEIVLRGSPEAVHREADRIVRRFACSATPYHIARDGRRRVVLRAA